MHFTRALPLIFTLVLAPSAILADYLSYNGLAARDAYPAAYADAYDYSSSLTARDALPNIYQKFAAREAALDVDLAGYHALARRYEIERRGKTTKAQVDAAHKAMSDKYNECQKAEDDWDAMTEGPRKTEAGKKIVRMNNAFSQLRGRYERLADELRRGMR